MKKVKSKKKIKKNGGEENQRAYRIRLVASEATKALRAPMNKHTEMAFGEFWSRFIHMASGEVSLRFVLAGSSTLNTIQLMNVPTNCGRVVYTFNTPR